MGQEGYFLRPVCGTDAQPREQHPDFISRSRVAMKWSLLSKRPGGSLLCRALRCGGAFQCLTRSTSFMFGLMPLPTITAGLRQRR